VSLVIETRGLSRIYKSYEKPEGLWQSIRGFWDRKYVEKIALAPTDLQIEPGQIVGLVGANGAGKTTLLKMLSGLIHPTSGTASVLGYKPWERNPQFLKRMSILLGQKNQLWWDISPADSYNLLAEIYDLDRKKAQDKVQELAGILDCKHVLNTQLRRLSLGERMKMEIIGSLLHSPDVLFLDEPTIGLDIVAQTAIRKFMMEYVKNKGPTVILTSHYMDDIAKLADRLLLISKGAIVYDGTVPGFMNKTESTQKVSFSMSEPLMAALELLPELTLAQGEQQFSFDIPAVRLAPVLSKVTALPGVLDLKIEEANFEDVIHRFLETESRILSPGRTHKS
jgi:ABC-2 type transport system ATP-binding protein